MKAVYLQSHGQPDSIKIGQVADPTPLPGEVVVRMEAASVNHVDLYMRDSGAGIRHTLPLIMGVDGAGIVEDPNDQSGWKRGDRVVLYPAVYCEKCSQCLAGEQILCDTIKFLGEHRDGTFAEFTSVPASNLFRAPESVDLKELAALPVAYLTAWRMLFGKARLAPGQKVLIFGVGGGVSLAALQLAKLAGAEVAVTSTSVAKLRKATSFGADRVILTESDVVGEIMEWTGKSGVDVVIDNVGKATWSKGLKSLKKGGVLVCCGSTSGSDPSADLQRLFVRQITVIGSSAGNPSDLEQLLAVTRTGRLRPIVDHVFGLDDAVMALNHLEQREQFGKIILKIGAGS